MHDQIATGVPQPVGLSAPVFERPAHTSGSALLRMGRHLVFAMTQALAPATGVALPSAQPTVPTPRSVIGWEPCADYKLATYEQIEDYFRTLAAASPARMKLVEMGRTTEGRMQIMAVISSEEN